MATPAPPLDPEQRLRKMLEIARMATKPSYCVKEVAVLLDTSDDTVYRLIKSSALTGYRLSDKRRQRHGKYRVDFGALVDFIATEPDE